MNSVRHSFGQAIPSVSEGRVDSGLVELCDFFAPRKECGESLVLGTIVRTEGSTYRKAGARILFSESGDSSGLLSGGCLEAEFRERAARVLRSGKPQRVVFDSRTSDDPVWGTGLGCEGSNHVWLQPITPESDYAPLAYLDACLQNRRPGCVSTVIGGEVLASELGRSGYARIRGEDELAVELSACRAAKPEIQLVSFRSRLLEVFVSPRDIASGTFVVWRGSGRHSRRPVRRAPRLESYHFRSPPSPRFSGELSKRYNGIVREAGGVEPTSDPLLVRRRGDHES